MRKTYEEKKARKAARAAELANLSPAERRAVEQYEARHRRALKQYRAVPDGTPEKVKLLNLLERMEAKEEKGRGHDQCR